MSDFDFNTPPEYLDLVRSMSLRRTIGLDPCSNEHSMVGAVTSYDITTNGLAHSWRGHGMVFVNPPHSHSPHNIEPWMEKAADEFLTHKPDRWGQTQDALILLIPGKTDTAWFHDYVVQFEARCFLRGRIKYWHKGKPTTETGKFPSMFVYQGTATGRFMQTFGPYGWIS